MTTLAQDIKNEKQRGTAQKSVLAALGRFIPKTPEHFRIARYFNNALHVTDAQNLVVQHDAEALGLTADHKYDKFHGSLVDMEPMTTYISSLDYSQEIKLPVKELARALKAARAFSTHVDEVPRLTVAAGRATVSLQSALGDYQHVFDVDNDAFIYKVILPASVTKLLTSVKDAEVIISVSLRGDVYHVKVHLPYTNRTLYYLTGERT